MFMAQEPQIPSRHERRKVRVGSCSSLILMSASKTIGPQLEIETCKYDGNQTFDEAKSIENGGVNDQILTS